MTNEARGARAGSAYGRRLVALGYRSLDAIVETSIDAHCVGEQPCYRAAFVKALGLAFTAG